MNNIDVYEAGKLLEGNLHITILGAPWIREHCDTIAAVFKNFPEAPFLNMQVIDLGPDMQTHHILPEPSPDAPMYTIVFVPDSLATRHIINYLLREHRIPEWDKAKNGAPICHLTKPTRNARGVLSPELQAPYEQIIDCLVAAAHSNVVDERK